MRKITFVFTAAFALSVFFTGCSTTPIAMTQSNTPLYSKTVAENLGKTDGGDYAISALGIFMWGRPDLETALNEALQKKNGDALINVRCYEEYQYYLLFSITRVIVEGEAIRFAANPEPKGKTK